MKRQCALGISLATILTSVLLTGCCCPGKSTRGVGTGPSFKGPVGLQLYSLRADFPKDVAGTLRQVRGYGFKYVELAGTYDLAPEQFRIMLDTNGLAAVAGHFPFERYRNDVEGIARDAKLLGLEYVGCAWIPHEGDFDEKECLEAIAVFNRAGEALARHGLKFFYHNHGYEFQPYGPGTLFDLMMNETNAKYVSYEMDLFWTHHPGQDPARLLEKYGSRWALLHLKDMKKGVPIGELTGKSDVTNDVILGTGQIDLPVALRAARKAGVKYYFIEDESPTAGDQIPHSLRYLEQVRW